MNRHTRTLSGIVNTLLFVFMLAGLLLLQACNTFNSNTNVNGPGKGKGRLNVHMTDKPASHNISAIMVNITQIEINKSGSDSTSGWQVLSDSAQTVNLLDLTDGKKKLIASQDLAPGTYSQIRLILGANNTVKVNGVEFPLTVPSGMQTGIKVNANITVKAGDTFNILLDFNAAQSIHETGNGRFMMKPVIHSVDMQMDGTLKGSIAPVNVKSSVFAIMNQDTTSTFSDTTNGAFKIYGLTPGTYSLSIMPGDTTYMDTTLTNIQINSGDTTDVGTITLRKKPAAS